MNEYNTETGIRHIFRPGSLEPWALSIRFSEKMFDHIAALNVDRITNVMEAAEKLELEVSPLAILAELAIDN